MYLLTWGICCTSVAHVVLDYLQSLMPVKLRFESEIPYTLPDENFLTTLKEMILLNKCY